MLVIILGNILTLVAIGFTYLNGTSKQKKQMILCDIGSASFFSLSDLVLGGYSGFVINFTGILRNLSALYLPNSKYIGWVLSIAGALIGIVVNNHGLIGILPIFTGLYYSYCIIDKKASARKLKMALILNTLAFTLYAVVIFNVIGFVSDAIVATTTIIAYIRDGKETN